MDTENRPHLQALSSVSSSLVTGLREVLPALGDEIIAAIRDSVPEYARPLEGSFGRAGGADKITLEHDRLVSRPGDGE